jgi:hypothetical protein
MVEHVFVGLTWYAALKMYPYILNALYQVIPTDMRSITQIYDGGIFVCDRLGYERYL